MTTDKIDYETDAELVAMGFIHIADKGKTVLLSDKPKAVVEAQDYLDASAYVLVGGRILTGFVYEMTFRHKGKPDVVVRYESRGTPPALALCYVEDDRFRQFTLPGIWSAASRRTQEAEWLERQFMIRHRGISAFWIPVLDGSGLVHLSYASIGSSRPSR